MSRAVYLKTEPCLHSLVLNYYTQKHFFTCQLHLYDRRVSSTENSTASLSRSSLLRNKSYLAQIVAANAHVHPHALKQG